MKAVLITGYDGFLGKALTLKLLSKGYTVYGLSRHASFSAPNLTPLRGDILQPNLGLTERLGNIQTVFHLAALHKLGNDKDGKIWQTNVQGTQNVIDYCVQNDIRDLKFCSSAYIAGRNAYEQSKALGETMVKKSGIPHATIFKPSIVMGTAEHFYPGHFSQFVLLIINTLAKARVAWRKIEETLLLPVLLEPVLRIKGNPEGKINLIQLDQVVWGMSNIDETGTFWLTNPDPPTVKQICDWVGDYIMVRLKVMTEEYKRMPIEVLFDKKIAAFGPYLEGDDFPSHLQLSPPITRDFINQMLKSILG